MLFNVPQYIDVEDKVAGPLTAKQLGWMIAMGAVLFIMWTAIKSKPFFIISAIPVVMVFVAMAFVKPYGQPMINIVFSGIRFLFGPKIYIWKRTPQKIQTNVHQKQIQAAKEVQIEGYEERRRKAMENLKSIAKIIDSKGAEVDDEVKDILSRPRARK